MFWIHKTYEITPIDKACEARLQAFAQKNKFQLRTYELNQQYLFEKPNTAELKNMFSILLSIEKSQFSNKQLAVLKLRPNNWTLAALAGLILLAIICVFDKDSREITGLSFPLLITLPYIYRLYAHKILSELKGRLLPGFESSAEGRKEVFAGYANPLRFFLNFQRNAYILFVIVFITLMILWMFGITDRFFKPQ
jgi:hypothetical protein